MTQMLNSHYENINSDTECIQRSIINQNTLKIYIEHQTNHNPFADVFIAGISFHSVTKQHFEKPSKRYHIIAIAGWHQLL